MKTLFARALALLLPATAAVLHAQVPQLTNCQGRVAGGTVNSNGLGNPLGAANTDRGGNGQNNLSKSIAGLDLIDPNSFAVRITPGVAPVYLLPVMRRAATAGSETFGLMYTTDDFATVHDLVDSDLATATGGLRDPSLFHLDGVWYCACTLAAWVPAQYPPNPPAQHLFRILKSTDLVNWSTLADVSVTDCLGYVWAPKFFHDPHSDRMYVSLSGIFLEDGNHRPVLASASRSDLTTWSAWNTPSGLPANFIDFQITTDGVFYYATGAASASAPSLAIYRSTTIASGYTLFSSFDFGAGVYAEQCWLECIGPNTWSMCYTLPSMYKTYRRISIDGMATWSTPTQINNYTTSAKNFACPYLLQAAPAHGQPGQMRVIFGPIAAGSTYTVKYRTDLASGTWLPLTGVAQSDNGTERTITDLSATGPQKFYHIEITKP